LCFNQGLLTFVVFTAQLNVESDTVHFPL